MLEISSRRPRPTLLLVGVLLIQILLLAFQIKRGRDVRLIRVWSVEAMTPLQRTGTWFGSTLHSGWKGYVDLRRARAENDALRQELARLQLRNYQLESTAQELSRLQELLNFREANSSVPMLAAEVIGANADSSGQTLYINRGQGDGLRRDMGVITPAGVVGKILEVFPGTSQVLLISDRDSGVGAMLAPSRTHGVAKGTGNSLLRMDYVVNDEKVTLGEAIVTSGDDRIFPKDLPVGTAAGAQQGNPFQTILVKPAVRLDRLEEVIVLLTTTEFQPAVAGDVAIKAHSPVAAIPIGPAPSIPANSLGGNPPGNPGKRPATATTAPGDQKPITKQTAPNPSAAKPQ
jgi:rod shape-determining protein MreC